MERMDLSLFELNERVRRNCGQGIAETILGRIAHDMLSALKFMLKKHQIMHRDIKPDNVLLNRLGQVKLCDFGLSRIVTSADRHSLTEHVGCLAYQAPEQFASSTRHSYNHKADIWAVGLTLYHMATGENPFAKEVYKIGKVMKKRSIVFELEQPLYSKNFQEFIDAW